MHYYDFRVLFELLIIKNPEMTDDRFDYLVKDVWEEYNSDKDNYEESVTMWLKYYYQGNSFEDDDLFIPKKHYLD